MIDNATLRQMLNRALEGLTYESEAARREIWESVNDDLISHFTPVTDGLTPDERE